MNKEIMTNEAQILNLNQYLELVDVNEKELLTELFNHTDVQELNGDFEISFDDDDEFITDYF